jgi:hypothetical protein
MAKLCGRTNEPILQTQTRHFNEELALNILTPKSDLPSRHDLKNAVLCARRVAEMLPDLRELEESELTALSQELAEAAALLEQTITKLTGDPS